MDDSMYKHITKADPWPTNDGDFSQPDDHRWTWEHPYQDVRWSIERLGSLGSWHTKYVACVNGVPLRTPKGRERRFATWAAALYALRADKRTASHPERRA